MLLAMYIAVGEKQGVSRQAAGHHPERHPQGVLQPGHLYLPPKPSMRIITDIFAYCAAEVPNWNTISISGYHIREAGSTAVQEVAFTLANGLAYVQAAVDAGLRWTNSAPG
jgi:methylmalonyl-CoA mutase N-terminal domain/subunit